jgi:hypothetical protein
VLDSRCINPQNVSVTRRAEVGIRHLPFDADVTSISDDHSLPVLSYAADAFWDLPDGTRCTTGPYYFVSMWALGRARRLPNVFIVAFDAKALAVCPAPGFSLLRGYTLDFDGTSFTLGAGGDDP